ncbi:hypothetical protein WJX77_010082 [Trebouxia sp. C0004]
MQKFTAIDSPMTDALGETSKAQAEAEGVHYIQNPNMGHVTNSQLQDLHNDLASYVYKGDPPAEEPNTFLWQLATQQVLPQAPPLRCDESLASFTCFLKSQLTVSQLRSALHPALTSTNIYWPSVGVTAPLVDTPGTSDTNPLNVETTHQAIDDAIDCSSQLLLCGNKTFDTEGCLQPYVVQYMKHMITSQHGQPAVQGILMAAQWHNAASLNDDFNQNADKARVASSINQLQIWLKEANSELPAEDQAPATCLVRCSVKAVYMNSSMHRYACTPMASFLP